MACIPDERNKTQDYFDEIEKRRIGANLPQTYEWRK
jgi:hypothetical protein